MNKIFKTKYDVTTGQTKVVSELARNRQLASSSEKTPKCGVFSSGILGQFKVLPLALVMAAALPPSAFAANSFYIVSYGEVLSAEKNGMEYCWKDGKKYQCQHVALNPSSGNTTDNASVGIQGVAVGHGAWAKNQGSTGIGANAHAIGAQSVVVGNNSAANSQSVALGSDVFAYGKSAIAIGNDDIDDSRFNDKLPVKTIEELFENVGVNTDYFKDGWGTFKSKYSISNGVDNRQYSPTYARGVGSIAIGSRNIAGGDLSTSLGALSFALANRSTAIGVRSFVSKDSEGGVAIGDESRVFAKNSFAIGNYAEAVNTGALSYGSGSKAVGVGSLALGSDVTANAKLTKDSAEKFRSKLMSELGIGTINERKDDSYTTLTYADVSDLKIGNDNEVVQSGFSAHLADDKISQKIESIIKDLDVQYERESETYLTVGGKEIKKIRREGNHAVTLGYRTANSGENTIAIGTASYVRGKNSVVLGALNNVGQYASNVVAIGIGTNVHKENSIALGTGTTVTGAGVVAIGSGIGVTKDNTIAVGYGAHGLSSESIVLGNSAGLKDHASKSIVIGNGAKVENKNKENELKNLRWSKTRSNTELEMSAIAVGTGAVVTAQNGVALGNTAEVSMENSVALGNKSHTKYFYQDTNKNTATLTGKDAISLAPYVPEGSSYNLRTDKSAGIVSVGWTKDRNELGLRRIVGVAPGALDSDVATIGQLKALAYVKKEGVVTYYTEENGKIYKVVKNPDGKFFKVNTDNGTPLDDKEINKSQVFAGPKGANEKVIDISGKKTADMGEKIKFAHILDGEISKTSDQAVTGSQLYSVKDVLGVALDNNNTKLKKPTFEAVEYVTTSKEGATDNFKDALNTAITAINQGYKFSDGTNTNTGTSKYYLGSTLEIKNGDVDGAKGQNLTVKLDTSKNDKATFTIGMSETPTFKNITITETPTGENHIVKNMWIIYLKI